MLNLLINNIQFVNPSSLIRAIKKIPLDIKIWGTDIKPLGYFASSTFVDHYILSPSVDDTKQYLLFMKNLCIENNIHLIIPGSDKDVQFYSKFKDEFSAIIVLPEERAIETFNDKYKATTAVSKCGLNIPILATNLFNEEKIIFRKKISTSSKDIHIINMQEAREIPNFFNEDYFVQKFISGIEYTVDLFVDNSGKAKLILPRKRLEIRNGMSTCCQLCKHEKIIQSCQTLLHHYYLPGLTNIQFIESKGDIYFIELNMRFAGSGIAGIIASFNYLQEYIEHFVYGKPLKSFDYYMEKVAWNSIISRYYDECVYSP